jgi:hypothetical protein
MLYRSTIRFCNPSSTPLSYRSRHACFFPSHRPPAFLICGRNASSSIRTRRLIRVPSRGGPGSRTVSSMIGSTVLRRCCSPSSYPWRPHTNGFPCCARSLYVPLFPGRRIDRIFIPPCCCVQYPINHYSGENKLNILNRKYRISRSFALIAFSGAGLLIRQTQPACTARGGVLPTARKRRVRAARRR